MADSLDALKEGVMALVMAVLVIAALALALDGFQDAIEDDNPCMTTGYSWNSSEGACGNSTNSLTADTNAQWNTTQEGLSGVGNASGYFDTIGTLIGVAALIAIVVGAFYFIKR